MDIEDLYQRYGPMVLRRCRQLLAEEQAALDACQDVFVKLLEQRAKLTDSYPSSLLYRMATNLCLNRIRDRKRRPETRDERVLHAIAASEDNESRLAVRSLLDRLFGAHQPSSRTIAVFHFVDGMTLEETAREVGMSVSGVRKRLRLLRQTLEEWNES
jgi:RNA polymerase sigma factor (sigma-70 family)